MRNLSVVTGKVVIKNLLVQMNYPDTGAHTLVRRSLCVQCVTGDSCEAIT